ncbi:MAG: hypothetical protein GYB67_18280 [Chloroflexi bacterium]|nr:hypothetical protein [Chloroflexota bacterium]
MTLGSLGWANRTGGKLTTQERLDMALSAARMQITDWLARTRPPHFTRVDVAALQLPDTAIVQDAFALCTAVSSPTLVNHCLRTYCWGVIFAQADDLRYDAELLAVAGALHDLGLADAYKAKDPTAHCYAVEGGRVASGFVAERGWPPERCDRLNEMIALHLNVQVSVKQGAEAHLLNAGAALDVIGLRHREIAPETLTAVLERYPRLGFKAAIAAVLRDQTQQRPQSRIAWLRTIAQLRSRIYSAPFPE